MLQVKGAWQLAYAGMDAIHRLGRGAAASVKVVWAVKVPQFTIKVAPEAVRLKCGSPGAEPLLGK